jgi:hypothetical protein
MPASRSASALSNAAGSLATADDLPRVFERFSL